MIRRLLMLAAVLSALIVLPAMIAGGAQAACAEASITVELIGAALPDPSGDEPVGATPEGSGAEVGPFLPAEAGGLLAAETRHRLAVPEVLTFSAPARPPVPPPRMFTRPA